MERALAARWRRERRRERRVHWVCTAQLCLLGSRGVSVWRATTLLGFVVRGPEARRSCVYLEAAG
eukprot:scaffold2183_cov140-Isochrysis_galbana.AAC.18